MSPKKRPPELIVQKISQITVKHSFINAYTLAPLSKQMIPDEERDYILRFRRALFKYRGFKTIEIFDLDHEFVAALAFDDYLDEEDVDRLDALLNFARKRSRFLFIEIETPLMVDLEPIICVVAGYFYQGVWFHVTEEYFESFSYCDDEGNEISIPKTCKFIHLLF